MADSQVKTANICNITSGTRLNANSGGSGTYIADNSISVHMTSDGRASGIYVDTLPEQGVIGDKYTISFVPVGATNNVMLVVLYGVTTQISFTSGNRYTLTITATAADNIMAFFGANSVEKTIIIKDIQIEKGETATPYRPYSSTGWLHSLRKLTTATEAVENPLYSDGTAITAYTLKGNEEHTGTPTPSNPVDVNGVGVRTENLFDVLDYTNIPTSTNGGASNVAKTTSTISFKSDGENDFSGIYISSAYYGVHIDDYDISTIYTLSADVYTDVPCTIIFGGSTAIVSIPAGTSRLSYRFSGSIALAFYIRNTTANITISKIMYAINNSTYEPYGYKIPISSGGVTTNIYLGSTQTVRQVKKLVLTGNENISNATQLTVGYRFSINIPTGKLSSAQTSSICTHFVYKTDWNQLGFTFGSADNQLFIMADISGVNDTTTFANWLAQQYANGTPVTVWYVLATPQTVAVSEPLMKIGTYSDTLSDAMEIPTTEGANSITVDTTVQPSEFTATWTGWHDASVKEKSENYLDENDFGLVEVAAGTYRVGTDVGVLPSGKYTFNAVKSSSAVQIYRTTKNGSTYNYEAISELPYTFTADGVSNQIFRSAGNTGSSWAGLGYSDIMLSTGETAQTYEPYWQ